MCVAENVECEKACAVCFFGFLCPGCAYDLEYAVELFFCDCMCLAVSDIMDDSRVIVRWCPQPESFSHEAVGA